MPDQSTQLTVALLQLARLVGAQRPLPELLDAAATTVAETLGYETVCINLTDELTGSLVAAAVHGPTAARTALLGSTSDLGDWEGLLSGSFDRGGAYFVPAGSRDDRADSLTTYVARRPAPEVPEDWDCEDMLIVPLRRHDAGLLGIVSVDEPLDGRRPDADRIAVLVTMTAHVAHLVESAHAATAATAREAALHALLSESEARAADRDPVTAIRRLCAAAGERLGYRSVTVVSGGCGWLGPGSVDIELDVDPESGHAGARLVATGLLPGPLPVADRERLLRSAALRVGALLNSIAQRALRRSEARKNTVLNASLDAIIVLDPAGRVTGFNPAAREMFGWEDDDALGQELWDLAGPLACEADERARLATSLLGPAAGRRVVEARRRNGETFPCEISVARSTDFDGEDLYTVYLRDISERIAAAAALREERDRARHAAVHDQLTGLLNREGFGRAVECLIGETGDGPPVITGVVDVDDFSAVNRSFGREVGDRVLVAVTERLRALAIPGAVIARTGSDEFAVAGRPERATLDRLAGMRLLLDEPLRLDGGGELHMSASCGLAVAGAGETADTVFSHAKSALTRAQSTPEGAAWYTPGLDDSGTDLALVAELRHALRAEEFEVYFQPLMELDDGAIAGYEALLRWRRDGVLVPPAEFIPVAETSGLIEPIGEWVIDRACGQLATWDDQGRSPAYISVNVAPRQLRRGTLPEVIALALEHHGVSADRLLVEVTEGAMAPGSGALEVLERVRALGVRCALDDFGADYSSLSRLAQLPFDVIKLDRSFLVEVPEDPAAARIAAAILELCAGLGLDTVVEGIETEEQLAFVRERATLGQGYLLGRPAPAWAVAPPGMIVACTSNASPASRCSSARRPSTASSA